MPREKKQPPIEEVLKNLIDNYSFDQRVTLHEGLTENIKGEALILRETGQKANAVLAKIESNGK